MNFKGSGRRLSDQDLPRIGAQLGVGEDEIHAVLDVETSGGGWDREGRLKMLFEPHKFWRRLGPGPKRDKAVALGLATPRWGQLRYPADSYPRLSLALAIDREAALTSCSWGLGQILGDNHHDAGYASVEAMIADFLLGEDRQLQGMVNFIKSNALDDELRGHDWAAFARGYNGPLYARHGYHLKLASAFQRWRAISDTSWRGERPPVDATAPAPSSASAPDVATSLSTSTTPSPTPPGPRAGFWARFIAAFLVGFRRTA